MDEVVVWSKKKNRHSGHGNSYNGGGGREFYRDLFELVLKLYTYLRFLFC